MLYDEIFSDDFPDSRKSLDDGFGLPYKKLPTKKFGINWFPNLEKNEIEEEYIKNIILSELIKEYQGNDIIVSEAIPK